MKGRLFPLVFSLLFTLSALGNNIPYGSLMVPVEFTVENGTYASSKIVITKKSGETVYSKSGQHNLRFKLDYGDEYLLSFSKPGYITKKILVNTTVPVDHGKQGFEPYKIGVKIFKQYEGVNIVVYNQPVALIKYHNELDEFNYDTDYTRSILSLLTVTEKLLEQKAAEEREEMKMASAKKPQISNNVITEPVSSTKKDHIGSSDDVRNTPVVSTTNTSSENNVSDKSKENKTQTLEEENRVKRAPVTGEDTPPSNNAVADKEIPPAKSSIFLDHDTVKFSDNKNIDELPVIHVRNKREEKGIVLHSPAEIKEPDISVNPTNNGNDMPKKLSIMNFGKEKAPVKEFEKEHLERTIEKTVEANRVITTIRVMEGDHITEYRHIVYNWGGEYFFVNKTTPISEHLFDLFIGQ